MKNMQQSEARKHLQTMLEGIERAHHLAAKGQSISALHALLQAKRMGKLSIAALLGDCLSNSSAQADQASISHLAELIGFAQQALCPTCRSEVGKKRQEAEHV